MSTDFDLARDLSAFAGDDLGEDVDGEPPDLTDADQVNRTLRRIRTCQRESDEISALAAAELQRITAWAEDRKAGVERQRAWLERAVEGWMRQHNAATGAKTVELPNGKVKLRAARPSVHVFEEGIDALAASRPDLVRVRLSVNRSAVAKVATPGEESKEIAGGYVDPDGVEHVIDTFNQAVTEDGEILPGVCFVVHHQPTFSVDVSETDQPVEPGVD